MPDKFSKEVRSRIMGSIRGKNTKPELIVRRALWGQGYTYQPKMIGRPDFVHKKRKIAIFVHGCFWHKCPIHYKQPKSNTSYWIPKIRTNVLRDKRNEKLLREEGYNVIKLWEHQIKKGLKVKSR